MCADVTCQRWQNAIRWIKMLAGCKQKPDKLSGVVDVLFCDKLYIFKLLFDS